MTEKLLTIAALSAYLSLPKSSIYRLTSTGKIPHVKIGQLCRFRLSEIDSWLEANAKGKAAPERKSVV